MAHANLSYPTAADGPVALSQPVPLSLSIFADRAHLRGTLREDAMAAGFRVGAVGNLASLLEGEVRALGDVVLVDCPEVDGARLAALARLDMRAAHAGTELVVSTSVDALDDVFACMDQSRPQILVDATRADRLIALGRLLGDLADLRLRELGEQDRLMLLRLTEQVTRIAERLERIEGKPPADVSSSPAVEAPKRGFRGEGKGRAEPSGDRLERPARPALPDPRLVRRMIRQRQMRARFFDGDLFADPAWDMLLDLTAARVEHVRVSVTSLCIASSVPATTALRWIAQMTDAGLFERMEDETDRRRVFITLSDRAADAMARYFHELGQSASQVV